MSESLTKKEIDEAKKVVASSKGKSSMAGSTGNR
jgi:hypothetical protein